MLRFEKTVHAVAERVNWIAAAMLILMMLLTTGDVVLRFFRRPIPGTYEMIGLIGSAVIACALGYTSLTKGHIAVDLAVRKVSMKKQMVIEAVNALIASVLFAVTAWQGVLYGITLVRTGEVSLTIKIPIFPFAFSLAAGCALLCLVLLSQLLRALRLYRDITDR